MAISRADRRRERSGRAGELFASDADIALDVLELADLAWHDCYGEVSPPDAVIEDMWVVAGGDLRELVKAAHLAVTDYRDLRVAADQLRQG